MSDNPIDRSYKTSISTDNSSDEDFDAGRYSTPQGRKVNTGVVCVEVFRTQSYAIYERYHLCSIDILVTPVKYKIVMSTSCYELYTGT